MALVISPGLEELQVIFFIRLRRSSERKVSGLKVEREGGKKMGLGYRGRIITYMEEKYGEKETKEGRKKGKKERENWIDDFETFFNVYVFSLTIITHIINSSFFHCVYLSSHISSFLFFSLLNIPSPYFLSFLFLLSCNFLGMYTEEINKGGMYDVFWNVYLFIYLSINLFTVKIRGV